MKIAVTYENGQVFQHFGHTEQFKIYEAAEGKVVSARVAPGLQAWWEDKLASLRDGDTDTVEVRFLDAQTFALFLENQEEWLN